MKRLYIALLLLLIAAAAGFWCIHEYTAPGPLASPKTLIFNKGLGFEGVTDALAGQGAIAHPLYFRAAALVTGNATHFKAGEYAFAPGMSVKEIIKMIASGKVVIHKLTIAEGLDVREISALLQAEPLLTGDIPADIPEGSLLPETYHFTYGDTRAELVARMQKAMTQALDAAWAKRKADLPFTTPAQALALASIVEKETGVKNERGLVASVYINRLKRGMLLQADPTVIYGIEVAQGAELKRPLTSADLQAPSPYNTYVNTGLPPTPICNPGKASLEATLQPPDTNFLYFVATGTGGHYFAASMKEHEKNVAEYRHAESMQKKAAQP